MTAHTCSEAVPENPISSPSRMRTRSGLLPEPISSRRTRSKLLPQPISTPEAVPETISSPRTFSGSARVPLFSPPTPFSLGAKTPTAGTLKSVSLSDWWLTKIAADEKKSSLGIEGYESKGGYEVRLFSSGPISIRHESVTLQTLDGIQVCISGLINQARTLDNRFSLEVCNRFILGFPFNWKDYDKEEESIEKKHLSILFDDIPTNRLHDFLVTTASPSMRSKMLTDAVDSLSDLVGLSKKKSDETCEKSLEEEVSMVLGGRETKSMVRRKEDNEPSIVKRVRSSSRAKNKVVRFYEEQM